MKNKTITLLNQIIERAELEDKNHKAANVDGNASATVGESWMLFHLKSLRELILDEERRKNDTSDPSGCGHDHV